MRKYKFHGEKLVFKEGLAPFRGGYERRIGFVDIQGNIVIKPTYKRIGLLYPGFRDGLCKVSYRKRWGFINKNGEWVIPPIYNDVQSYSEGVAAVVQGNKVEYINTLGEKIFEKVFFSRLSYVNLSLFSGDFHEGLANVCFFDKGTKTFKRGFINKTGEFVFPPEFKDSEAYFSDGVAITKKHNHKHKGVLSHDGQYKEAKIFDYTKIFLDYTNIFYPGTGVAIYRNGKKYGLVDKQGVRVTEAIYERVFPFTEGLALVSYNGQRRFMDNSGKFVIENGQVNFEAPFSDGLALVRYKKHFGFMNHKGEFVIEPTLRRAFSFSDGVAEVEIDGKWGLINTKGEKIAGF